MDAIIALGLLDSVKCFNPRARDGRDLPPIGSIFFYDVSIHAPVMDAI